MTSDDDPGQSRPDALVERMGRSTPPNHRPANYAPAVSRLRQRLPTAPSDRRAKPRLDDVIWRGRLIDVER
jgi:hypothetical protein